MEALLVQAAGYTLPLDRYYHRVDNLWVRVEGELCRIGMDVLGQEMSGDLAQLALVAPGTDLEAGMEMGTLEAQKFVGALRSPISGTVVTVNEHLFSEPRLVNSDPFGEGWMLMVRPSQDLDQELAQMAFGEAVVPWFEERVKECRLMGILAE